ncbi:hypothetical protein VTO42DRAFT_6734 [Malbranchea cinnamomea]
MAALDTSTSLQGGKAPSSAVSDHKIQPSVMYEPVAEPVELKKMMHESIYITGGQFAILLQFGNPRLAQGSAEHSDFAVRILNRLKTTSRYLVAAVYGTPEEKAAITSVIHKAHSVVKKENKYSADDPELHKWTAATLFVSMLKVHETFLGKLPDDLVEKLYKESAIFGTCLRMPPEMWPATLDDFWEYWNHNIETLEITHWAKDLGRSLMYPINIPWYLRPALPTARLLTAAWLPERIRVAYGFLPDPAKHRMLLKSTIAAISTAYRLTPVYVRSIPHRYYKKNMAKAVRRIQETGSWSRL